MRDDLSGGEELKFFKTLVFSSAHKTKQEIKQNVQLDEVVIERKDFEWNFRELM